MILVVVVFFFKDTHHKPVPHGSFANPEPRAARSRVRQDALDRHVQLGAVHFVASRVQLRAVLLHEQRDVLPVVGRQVSVLYGNHLLLVLGGVDDVQGVGLAVGDNLQDGSRPVLLLHGQEAPACLLKLLEVHQQEEASLGVDGVDQVPKGALGQRGDEVRVEDLVGGAVRVVSFDQGDPVVLSWHLDELKQVVDAVVVATLCR